VVDGGRIVGTWQRTGRGSARMIQATPFSQFSQRVRSALPRASTALEHAAGTPGRGG